MSGLTHVALGTEVSLGTGWVSCKHLSGFSLAVFLFIYVRSFLAGQDAPLLFLQLGQLSAIIVSAVLV